MSYAEAREKYAALGVDTDAAIANLKTVPVSLHCWQGDDVRGFDTDPETRHPLNSNQICNWAKNNPQYRLSNTEGCYSLLVSSIIDLTSLSTDWISFLRYPGVT